MADDAILGKTRIKSNKIFAFNPKVPSWRNFSRLNGRRAGLLGAGNRQNNGKSMVDAGGFANVLQPKDFELRHTKAIKIPEI